MENVWLSKSTQIYLYIFYSCVLSWFCAWVGEIFCALDLGKGGQKPWVAGRRGNESPWPGYKVTKIGKLIKSKAGRFAAQTLIILLRFYGCSRCKSAKQCVMSAIILPRPDNVVLIIVISKFDRIWQEINNLHFLGLWVRLLFSYQDQCAIDVCM